ncbi:MAG TPA: glycine--tRNA ligase subunit beta [Fimbriimonadaceae bacterium]|nr:glycine--tRNA ligase subunit beta [Fimbriimonadaceae bacterium]
MPELLLEVGCEELPATFVRKAYADLHDRVAAALAELFGGEFSGTSMGTPRRLIISFADVPERQSDSTKEIRGPALKAAYDGSGNPTPALLGFCRSNGVEPGELRKDEQYVWVTKAMAGRPTVELLAEALPKAIRALGFEKSMRWGEARMRFARPLRWILAAFDREPVEFEIEGVKSGLESRGHRFYASGSFTARTLAELTMGLRERKVEPEVEHRISAIIDQAKAVAEGVPDLPEDLVEENAFLTEWPTAIAGEYRKEHSSLPGSVLTTAMAKHERMFPIRDADGGLVNRFIFVRNSGEDDSVRRGAEWVLNARLDDAQFFYREDLKHDLDYFLEKTSGIVYQEKLGTVRERADRLERLAAHIAEQTGASKEEVEFARVAGKYAKADLSTGLVSDMASLQGIVGGEYARRMGMPDPVCWAIASHYDHNKNPEPKCEGARTSLRLCLADNLEKLAGYLGLGLVPSGSSDPFGLRRSATALIEIAIRWPDARIHFANLIEGIAATSKSSESGTPQTVSRALTSLFTGRYEALFSDARYDVLEAATHTEDSLVLAPCHVACRIEALTALAIDLPFTQAATRPLNILTAARKKGVAVGETLADEPAEGIADLGDLASKEGEELFEAMLDVREGLTQAFRANDSVLVVLEIRRLETPINVFFEKTMVMAEDPKQQFARLTLVKAVSDVLYLVGDFSKLVVEG